MDEPRDFETYYTSRILPLISDLKSKKHVVTNWGIVLYSSLFLTITSFFIDQFIAGGFLIGLLIVSIYFYTRNRDRFITRFKETIINDIINFIHPGLIYKPDDIVPAKEYKASGHYRYIYDYYEGDDYIEGVYKNVNFHCCELETFLERSRRGITGHWENANSRDIFKGLFFVAVINKFRGGTYIWTKGAEQLPVSVMDEYYRLFPLPSVQKVKVVNEEFSKYFSVYTTYPAEAIAFLDADMIQRMLNFRKQVNREVQFSVVAGKIYVSIPINEDLLEPASPDLDDKEKIRSYFFSILLVLSIINQLQLNRFA